MNKKTRYIPLLALAITFSTNAGSLTIPNSFTSNTPAVASEVNANFTETKNAVDDNDTRITTNSSDISTNTSAIAAISGGLKVVKDSDGTDVGQLVSSDSRSWLVLNTSGYLVDVTANGVPTAELVYFSGAGCTGTPYLLVNNTGGAATAEQSNPVYAKQGYVFTDFQKAGTYYVAKNTPVTSSFTHASRYLTSGCQATSSTIDAIQAATNVPGTTGVPNGGYGAVSLQ